MKLMSFEEAQRAEIIIREAHAHGIRVNQSCVSEMYRTEPRSHSGLIYVLTGAHLFVDSFGREITISANEMLYAPEGCNYYHRPLIDETDENGNLITHTEVFVADFKLTLNDESVVFSDRIMRIDTEHKKMLGEKFINMVNGYSSAMPSYFRFLSQLFGILNDICDEYAKKRLSPRKYEMIKPAIEYLANNDAASADVCELAELCYISKNYFRKLFYDYYGCLPHQYLNELKLKRAAILLETGDYSISDISVMLGYATPSYFSSCFKNYYGYLPSKYKK
ncbi:MAG: helix-turn-helix transcriptional regulator [Clostridia bacterium]|nr:helix-turn-helix transcriptional regulator [Clostridia bacterium]